MVRLLLVVAPLSARLKRALANLTYDNFVWSARRPPVNRKDYPMRPILTRNYYRHGYQHLEDVLKTGSSEFEIKGHAAGPLGGPYRYPVSIAELLRMSNDTPWSTKA
jgi:hypothetical protein